MNVVEIPFSCQQDAAEFLRAVIKDLENGQMPAVSRGLLVVGYEQGGYSVWGFGPKCGGAHMQLSLATLSMQMISDTILGE